MKNGIGKRWRNVFVHDDVPNWPLSQREKQGTLHLFFEVGSTLGNVKPLLFAGRPFSL